MNKKTVEQRAAVFDHLFDVVIITDNAGSIMDWNQAAEHLLGYLREEIAGQPISKVFSPDTGTTLQEDALAAVLQRGGWSGEMELFHRSGYGKQVKTLAVPLPGGKQPLGVIWINRDISDYKLLEKQMKMMEQYDSLTGIPNWGVIYDRAEHLIATSRRNQTIFALMFLDLNNFRDINESAGYKTGNEILREVAERLKHVLRQSDTVGRIGADEFVVLAPDIHNEKDVGRVAENIMAALKGAFIVEGNTYHVSGRIGVALYPKDGDTSDELVIKASDAAFNQRRLHKK